MEFPGIVTSAQCLACKGCCAFLHSGGDWSPRLTPEDISLLTEADPERTWLNGEERVSLVPSSRGQACFFLDEASHHCRVYAKRPYECRLYPFLLSHEDGVVKLYAHLSCPALGELFKKDDWRRRISSTRAFFQQDATLAWVRENARYFVDYRPFLAEMKYLFDVAVVDEGARLLQIKPEIDAALACRREVIPRLKADGSPSVSSEILPLCARQNDVMERLSSTCSAFHFSQLFVWKDAFIFEAVQIENSTLVFARQPVGTFLFWPPLGKIISSKAIEHAFRIMREENGPGGVSRIENVSEADLSAFADERFIKHLRGHEYIYRRADIAALAGKKYHAKRHEINMLMRSHHVEYRPFVASDAQACRILFEQWLDVKRMKYDDEVYRSMLSENRAVHTSVFLNADALGLIGRVAVIDGKVKAYTFGYPLSESIFCVFLEVADPAVAGLASFIFREFAADAALKDVEHINAMDDFGMPHVAAAKRHWHPSVLQPVYTVSMAESS